MLKLLHEYMYGRVQKLTPQCGDHIRTLMKESAVDFLQDAALAHACAVEVFTEFIH